MGIGTRYPTSFRVKDNNAGAAMHMLTTDMAWSRRIAIFASTYNWREYDSESKELNKYYESERLKGSIWGYLKGADFFKRDASPISNLTI